AVGPPHTPAALPLHRGAFELKYVLDEQTAARVRDWAMENLSSDPHASGDVADGYHVNNLYLDTPHFDVFHRTPQSGRRKFRLRRYGRESQLWLEEKRKRQGCVFKRRVLIDERELGERLFASEPDADWIGAWFRKRLENRKLLPACQVTYRRFARVKATPNGPIRLTMDDQLRTAPADAWLVPAQPAPSNCLLDGRVILELKFIEAMPALYRRLIDDLKLGVGSFSKYRTSISTVFPADVLKTGRTTPGALHA
ncbi:MAG TPA: polyphosphate polymerase domain-containing protein, partial [Pirellulales bacterium]